MISRAVKLARRLNGEFRFVGFLHLAHMNVPQDLVLNILLLLQNKIGECFFTRADLTLHATVRFEPVKLIFEFAFRKRSLKPDIFVVLKGCLDAEWLPSHRSGKALSAAPVVCVAVSNITASYAKRTRRA